MRNSATVAVYLCDRRTERYETERLVLFLAPPKMIGKANIIKLMLPLAVNVQFVLEHQRGAP